MASLTQAQIDTLVTALASGTKTTTVDGTTVVARSISEIIQALNYAEELNQTPGTRPFKLGRFDSPGTIYDSYGEG